jgi:hypothetical protein
VKQIPPPLGKGKKKILDLTITSTRIFFDGEMIMGVGKGGRGRGIGKLSRPGF